MCDNKRITCLAISMHLSACLKANVNFVYEENGMAATPDQVLGQIVSSFTMGTMGTALRAWH